MGMTTDELSTFVTVVDAGSVTRAAEQLGQTASAVSRTLARLEGKVGNALLRRTTRRSQLSHEGTLLLPRARAILAALDDAEAMLLTQSHGPAGPLRVDAAAPFMRCCVVPHVAEFTRAYPRISLQLTCHERNIDLLEEKTDVALRIGSLQDSGLRARRLGESPLRVLASPDYLEKRGWPACARDLAEHQLIGFTEPESLNLWPLRTSEGEGVLIRPNLAGSSGETLLELARAGLGIVCLADYLTYADRQKGTLVSVLEQVRVPDAQVVHAVYYRQGVLEQRVRCFVDFLAARWNPGAMS